MQHIHGTEGNISKEQQLVDLMEEKLLTFESEKEEDTFLPQEPEETVSAQIQWQVYIQPDMPEPFIEILKQYEQFMNAGVEDLNDKDVMDKLYRIDGEWRYLYDIYCGRWKWDVEDHEEE